MKKKIINLNKDDIFIISGFNYLKGIVRKHSNMGTTVFWIEIPKDWLKKNYDELSMLNKNGKVYQELDTFFYRKNMLISSETEVEI